MSRKPAKTQHGGTTTPKRNNAPTEARPASSTLADLQKQVSALTRELAEAREQQSATSEVRASSQVRPARWGQFSRPFWRTPHISAKPSSGICSSAKEMPFAWAATQQPCGELATESGSQDF